MLTSALAGGALAANDPPRGIGPGFVGFVVIFLLAVACYLLFRSMTGHLRKVRYTPDPSRPEPPPGEPGDVAAPPDDAPHVDRAGPMAPTRDTSTS
jgi:hypothetical protein